MGPNLTTRKLAGSNALVLVLAASRSTEGGRPMATRRTGKTVKRTTTKAAGKKAAARNPRGAKAKAVKKAPRKKAAARAKALTPEALARKIVKGAQDPSKLVIEELYAEECRSWEPGGTQPAVGHDGIRTKLAFWEGFQDSARAVWEAKNVFVRRNTVCIEWEAQLFTRDGREIRFSEVAIHQLKGGKIADERYYYDRAALAPPAAEPRAPEPQLAPPPPAPEPTGPEPDPLDL